MLHEPGPQISSAPERGEGEREGGVNMPAQGAVAFKDRGEASQGAGVLKVQVHIRVTLAAGGEFFILTGTGGLGMEC